MDEETEQMKNLNTDIETTKRKSINHEELDKSINEERDLKNKMDEFTMLTKKIKMMGMIMLILMLFKEEVKQNLKKQI